MKHFIKLLKRLQLKNKANKTKDPKDFVTHKKQCIFSGTKQTIQR